MMQLAAWREAAWSALAPPRTSPGAGGDTLPATATQVGRGGGGAGAYGSPGAAAAALEVASPLTQTAMLLSLARSSSIGSPATAGAGTSAGGDGTPARAALHASPPSAARRRSRADSAWASLPGAPGTAASEHSFVGTPSSVGGGSRSRSGSRRRRRPSSVLGALASVDEEEEEAVSSLWSWLASGRWDYDDCAGDASDSDGEPGHAATSPALLASSEPGSPLAADIDDGSRLRGARSVAKALMFGDATGDGSDGAAGTTGEAEVSPWLAGWREGVALVDGAVGAAQRWLEGAARGEAAAEPGAVERSAVTLWCDAAATLIALPALALAATTPAGAAVAIPAALEGREVGGAGSSAAARQPAIARSAACSLAVMLALWPCVAPVLSPLLVQSLCRLAWLRHIPASLLARCMESSGSGGGGDRAAVRQPAHALALALAASAETVAASSSEGVHAATTVSLHRLLQAACCDVAPASTPLPSLGTIVGTAMAAERRELADIAAVAALERTTTLPFGGGSGGGAAPALAGPADLSLPFDARFDSRAHAMPHRSNVGASGSGTDTPRTSPVTGSGSALRDYSARERLRDAFLALVASHRDGAAGGHALEGGAGRSSSGRHRSLSPQPRGSLPRGSMDAVRAAYRPAFGIWFARLFLHEFLLFVDHDTVTSCVGDVRLLASLPPPPPRATATVQSQPGRPSAPGAAPAPMQQTTAGALAQPQGTAVAMAAHDVMSPVAGDETALSTAAFLDKVALLQSRMAGEGERPTVSTGRGGRIVAQTRSSSWASVVSQAGTPSEASREPPQATVSPVPAPVITPPSAVAGPAPAPSWAQRLTRAAGETAAAAAAGTSTGASAWRSLNGGGAGPMAAKGASFSVASPRGDDAAPLGMTLRLASLEKRLTGGTTVLPAAAATSVESAASTRSKRRLPVTTTAVAQPSPQLVAAAAAVPLPAAPAAATVPESPMAAPPPPSGSSSSGGSDSSLAAVTLPLTPRGGGEPRHDGSGKSERWFLDLLLTLDCATLVHAAIHLARAVLAAPGAAIDDILRDDELRGRPGAAAVIHVAHTRLFALHRAAALARLIAAATFASLHDGLTSAYPGEVALTAAMWRASAAPLDVPSHLHSASRDSRTLVTAVACGCELLRALPQRALEQPPPWLRDTVSALWAARTIAAASSLHHPALLPASPLQPSSFAFGAHGGAGTAAAAALCAAAVEAAVEAAGGTRSILATATTAAAIADHARRMLVGGREASSGEAACASGIGQRLLLEHCGDLRALANLLLACKAAWRQRLRGRLAELGRAGEEAWRGDPLGVDAALWSAAAAAGHGNSSTATSLAMHPLEPTPSDLSLSVSLALPLAGAAGSLLPTLMPPSAPLLPPARPSPPGLPALPPPSGPLGHTWSSSSATDVGGSPGRGSVQGGMSGRAVRIIRPQLVSGSGVGASTAGTMATLRTLWQRQQPSFAALAGAIGSWLRGEVGSSGPRLAVEVREDARAALAEGVARLLAAARLTRGEGVRGDGDQQRLQGHASIIADVVASEALGGGGAAPRA